MRLVRMLAGTVLWLLACVLGLVSVLLCVTILLLPVGIPLMRYSRNLFRTAVRLMLPRAVIHPVDEISKGVGKRGRRAKSTVEDSTSTMGKKARKTRKKLRKKLS